MRRFTPSGGAASSAVATASHLAAVSRMDCSVPGYQLPAIVLFRAMIVEKK
jgi:hypothetical protein